MKDVKISPTPDTRPVSELEPQVFTHPQYPHWNRYHSRALPKPDQHRPHLKRLTKLLMTWYGRMYLRLKGLIK